MPIIRKYPPRGMYIYELLTSHGYSIQTGADLLGIDYRTLWRWITLENDMQTRSLRLVCDGLERIDGQSWEVHALEILRR
jgi:hypothetical protein